MMDITINHTHVNATQFHGLIFGDKEQATKLEGWDAFKNFFLKLLNHLPGISIVDKETKLQDIYQRIYPDAIQSPTLDTKWRAVVELLDLIDDSTKHKVECGAEKNANEIALSITFAGQSLSDLVQETTSENTVIFNSIHQTYTPNNSHEPPGTYKVTLCKGRKEHYENAVTVEKALAETTKFLNTCTVCESVTTQRKYIAEHQSMIDKLSALKSEKSITSGNTERVDKAIDKVNDRMMKFESHYMAQHKNFLNGLIEKWGKYASKGVNPEKMEREAHSDITRINGKLGADPDLINGGLEAFFLKELKNELDVVAELADFHQRSQSADCVDVVELENAIKFIRSPALDNAQLATFFNQQLQILSKILKE